MSQFRIKRIHINQEGRDERGEFWGTGLPVFQSKEITGHEPRTHICRARDIALAKLKVREDYPDATFVTPGGN